MKFKAMSSVKEEPVAEFGVEIQSDGDPSLFVHYKGQKLYLLYLSKRRGYTAMGYGYDVYSTGYVNDGKLLDEVGIQMIHGKIVM